MKKTGLKGITKVFSVDFNPIYTNDILDIHKHLMKNNAWVNGLLNDLVNGSNHTKCILLSNQKCMIQSTLINLHQWIQSRISLLSICS